MASFSNSNVCHETLISLVNLSAISEPSDLGGWVARKFFSLRYASQYLSLLLYIVTSVVAATLDWRPAARTCIAHYVCRARWHKLSPIPFETRLCMATATIFIPWIGTCHAYTIQCMITFVTLARCHSMSGSLLQSDNTHEVAGYLKRTA